MNYFEFNSNRGGKADVALDVVEFDQPQPAGIEVQETRFASTAELLAHIARETGRGPAPAPKPRKYRNMPVVVDGIRFDSKLEARCYQELLLRKAAGDIWLLLRQVPFALEGGVVYRCDFFTVSRAGGG